MMQGGGTRFLTSAGPFIGPGHAGIVENGKRSWFSCHFYNAAKGGTSTLAIRSLRWDTEGWPIAELEL